MTAGNAGSAGSAAKNDNVVGQTTAEAATPDTAAAKSTDNTATADKPKPADDALPTGLQEIKEDTEKINKAASAASATLKEEAKKEEEAAAKNISKARENALFWEWHLKAVPFLDDRQRAQALEAYTNDCSTPEQDGALMTMIALVSNFKIHV